MPIQADRYCCGFPLWSRSAATGASLHRRVKSNVLFPEPESFRDGTRLSRLAGSGSNRGPAGKAARRRSRSIAVHPRLECRAVRYCPSRPNGPNERRIPNEILEERAVTGREQFKARVTSAKGAVVPCSAGDRSSESCTTEPRSPLRCASRQRNCTLGKVETAQE